MRTLACGQVVFDDGVAGICDMVTAAAWRGRGLATVYRYHYNARAGECA